MTLGLFTTVVFIELFRDGIGYLRNWERMTELVALTLCYVTLAENRGREGHTPGRVEGKRKVFFKLFLICIFLFLMCDTRLHTCGF